MRGYASSGHNLGLLPNSSPATLGVEERWSCALAPTRGLSSAEVPRTRLIKAQHVTGLETFFTG